MAKLKLGRPPKDPRVLEKIKNKSSRGEYVPVEHAKRRMDQRQVSDPEVRYVLQFGYREPRKDEFKDEFMCWNYSMKGKTVDDRILRIAVCFEENELLVITVIDLEN